MGTWTAMKHELAQMRTRDTGGDRELLLIGRARRRRRRATYDATKHGVIGLTASAALEYAARRIRVNAVAPARSTRPWSRA